MTKRQAHRIIARAEALGLPAPQVHVTFHGGRWYVQWPPSPFGYVGYEGALKTLEEMARGEKA
jgi:hypothetical protein